MSSLRRERCAKIRTDAEKINIGQGRRGKKNKHKKKGEREREREREQDEERGRSSVGERRQWYFGMYEGWDSRGLE